MSAFTSRRRRPSIDLLPRLAAVGGACLWLCCSAAAYATDAESCDKLAIDPLKAKVVGDSVEAHPGTCRPRVKNGIPLPDPKCTPGAVNPTITQKVLRDPDFRTSCVRDGATTASQKAKTYAFYGIEHPKDNRGVKQICELDHLISLELGGADTLENIWPQCGPSKVILRERYFKKKDLVENYLARRVRSGSMKLGDAQAAIAEDWTQFLDDVLQKDCRTTECDDQGLADRTSHPSTLVRLGGSRLVRRGTNSSRHTNSKRTAVCRTPVQRFFVPRR